ncbi:ATP-dependent DNA ligase [Microbacterium sp. P07]|uniref:DUF7882 family protein n=1 Tax=Microbacterium sp. P07 TaxID=3366952 RepID=UPI0037453DF1
MPVASVVVAPDPGRRLVHTRVNPDREVIVGYFMYDNITKTEIDDRLLAHLQIVIGTKLRRSESFFFTWKEDVSLGSGRTAVWVHPGAGLRFKFHGSRQPAISRPWLEALTHTANSPTGLYAVSEPADELAVARSDLRILA